ncbi:amidohydrolase [Acuticoccus sp. I52.16.1]|uniref:amidohydrolase family protein n=1 Tax=Acuticoccus sp. I52.16.1 TaxID=2928472 RepID=UPI001FD04085|nr:amidohydrolase family protein [Acuticoccus sp. I52.16.1]UOM35756.1 amidohydrolase family protein [Acuticoccus sp. I52.16.1]
MHLWDLSLGKHPWLCGEMIPFRYGDYSPIRRDYLAADYRRDAGPMNIVSTVYVEAEWDLADPFGETRWVHDYAAAAGFPGAVVAQAFLDAPDAADVIAGQAAFPLVRSIRHKPASAPGRADARRGAPKSMDDPQWRKGYEALAAHGLHFDLQTPWWHFDAAAELARDFPATTIVLNHTGLPADRSAEGLAGWRAAMETLAAEPNVAVKISGIGLKGERWDARANAFVVRDTLRIFGTERAMFASNFPVDSVVGELTTIFAGFAAITADLAPDVRRALFHDNAARIYRVAPAAAPQKHDKVLGGAS